MDFDPGATDSGDSGINADIAGAQPAFQTRAVDQYLVNTEGRQPASGNIKVGGGKTQSAAAAVAADHLAPQDDPLQTRAAAAGVLSMPEAMAA